MKTAYERIEESDDYFGIKELMNILKKSDSSIRRLINENHIHYYKTSNTYYFSKKHIKKFVEQVFI
ncbi:helix-turn-helix domain-containing protein [Cetobacterium somerae]|uniref:helix-turn-helix domain-containing protein n=1 Tax=Cetobacterium somerae TaxID=188913 RepID=UPI003D768761